VNIVPRFRIEDDDLDLLRRFTAYMKKVVHNAKIDYLRSQDYLKKEAIARRLLADGFITYGEPLPPSDDEFDFKNERLETMFSQLTQRRRRILTLAFVEGMSPQEVADRLNCPVKEVYNQTYEALKRLRRLMSEGGGGRGE
jgi:RNA polymerase sigma factor (sigma-70 family)